MTLLSEAREAIYQEFVDQWGGTTTFTFDNEAFNPPEGSSWVRLAVRSTVSSQETFGSIGNRKMKREGIVMVQVFTPLNQGVAGADTLVDLVRTFFEHRTVAGVWFKNCNVLEIGPEKDWYQVNVDSTFEFTEVK